MKTTDNLRAYNTVDMMASVMRTLQEYSVEEVAVICKRYKDRAALRKTHPGSQKVKREY